MEDKLRCQVSSRQKIHPQEKGNFLKHFFFCWQIPIFVKGLKKDLNEEDLYSTLKSHQSRILGDKLQQHWLYERNSTKTPSLRRAIIRTFGLEFLIKGLFYMPVDIFIFIGQPFFLSKFLDYFTVKENVAENEKYIYGALITFLALLRVIVFNFFLMEMTVFGMKVRIACSSLIYRNILEVRRTSTSDLTVGHMVNLLSNDVGKFDEAFTLFQYLWIAPVEMIVGGIYLDLQIGPAAYAGIGSLVVCLLIQMYISKKIFYARKEVAVKTDLRICLINDLISGIAAIKMHTWEEYFFKTIEKVRKAEIEKIQTTNFYRLSINSIYHYSSAVSIFFGVMTLIATKTPLTPQSLYAMESIYEMLTLSVVIFIPMSLIHLSEINVSVDRIEEFLFKNDVTPKTPKQASCDISHKQAKFYNIFQEGPHCISLRNVSARWHPSATHDVLRNITFTAHASDLIGVVGPSGCGKTTLLQAILGEIKTCGGIMNIEGSISYASQEPWIFSGTIRQNILFGQDLDIEKYHIIVQACCLEKDLLSLPQGDATLVGESGAMLSGGQKTRINLARAVYREADIYLLDDPLSSIDVHVARQLFEQLILQYLKTKCVILVTHQVQYLQAVTKIYLLEEGKIRDCGKYGKVVGLKHSVHDRDKVEFSPINIAKSLMQHEPVNDVKEHRSSGRNSRTVYKRYCQSAGHWSSTVLVLVLFILFQVFLNSCDYFLSVWINEKPVFIKNEEIVHFFGLYFAILGSVIATASLIVWSIVRYSINVSRNLHQNLLRKIIHNTMAFFNQNSFGRILNRFSKDIGAIDEFLPMTIMNALSGMLLVLGSVITVSLTNSWMILTSLAFVFIVGLCAVVFQPTNRNMKRTEGITKSSVLAHVTTTVQGLDTIRASGVQETLSLEFDNHQDLHTSASYLLTGLNCALGFWTDLFSTFYVGIVTFSFLLSPNKFSAGFIGLAVTQSTALVGLLQHVVKLWADVETHMTSVERVLDYIDLPEETDDGDFIPPVSWPLEGNITFDDINLKYFSQRAHALKALSIHIHAGEKIGVVGRTGAGKSSLISVLFRLFHFQGSIIIDGIDTKSLPLKHLRSNISIIPQEATLFSGSLRKNIDPWDKYLDFHIWKILEEFNLKQMVSILPLGLDTDISQCNFSVGEKQLFCLLRTVLENNKIIILDEATASVDLKTDQLIRDIVRKKFLHSTVLTIAHRLNTVIDSDKILVLDDGRIVEFGDPYILLQNPTGVFYKYVREHGFLATQQLKQ